MQKWSSFFVCICSILPLAASETLYSFADGKQFGNPSLVEEKQGYTASVSEHGLAVDYRKFADGGTSWCVVNLKRSSLKETDWDKAVNLVLKVETSGASFSPALELYLRGAGDKIFSKRVPLPANRVSQIIVPVAEIRKSIDPKTLSLLQFAVARPTGGTLRFLSLSVTDENDVPKLADAAGIYSFASGNWFPNPSVPEEKRNFTAELTPAGLKVDYRKFAEGKDSWPLVNIHGSALSRSDWSGAEDLIVSVRNLAPEYSPKLNIVVRGNGKAIYSTMLTVRCNSLSRLVIPVADIARKIDVKAVSMIQIAFPRPAMDCTLEYGAIYLAGQAEADAAARIVNRTLDLTPLLGSDSSAAVTIGKCKVSREGGAVIASFEKYRPGDDKWPGFTIQPRIEGAVDRGDLSTKTHLVAELEELPGSVSQGIGFSMADADGKNFWHGLGTISGTVAVERGIVGMGVDLANIRTLNIGCTTPSNGFSFRIKRLGFEFRPEVLLSQAVAELETLQGSGLSDSGRASVKQKIAELRQRYDAVKGESAKVGDVHAFLAAAGGVKKFRQDLLRRDNRAMFEPMIREYGYGLGIADSMTSIFLSEAGSPVSNAADGVLLELAGNENESFQLVVAAGAKPLKHMRAELELPAGFSGNAAVVGHAKTVAPTYPVEYTGFYPDFIIEYQQSADVAPEETVPFWVRVKAPAGTAPGEYSGSVKISGDGVKPFRIPLKIKVFGFSLPEGSPLPSSNNFHMAGIRKFYQIKNEAEWRELYDRFVDQAADYKISLDFLYRGPFTNLDKSTDYSYPALKRLAGRGQLKSFCILNSTVLKKEVNDPAHPEVAKQLERSRKHLDYWGKVAEEYGVKQFGYLYGFDEGRADAVFSAVLGTLRREYNLPVMTTAGIASIDQPAVKDIDIWVPTAPTYLKRIELVNELRKQNKKVWWYVCNFPRPPEPTLMLEVPAAVPRLLMGAMSWKYRPDGFLYWSIVAWPQGDRKPVTTGPRTDWNPATFLADNGEGNLFVPGSEKRILPTIRIENFRDGVEDLWYFTMLADAVRKAEAEKRAPELVAKAKQALEIGPELVRSTSEYTTDPQKIRLKRRQVAELLAALSHD